MQVLRTPVIHAVALALLLQATGLGLPRWAGNTATLLGDCAVPLMLVLLGVALARLRVAGLGRALAMSLVRLGLGFGVGLVVVEALDLEGVVRGVVLLESSMPLALLWRSGWNGLAWQRFLLGSGFREARHGPEPHRVGGGSRAPAGAVPRPSVSSGAAVDVPALGGGPDRTG